METLYVLCMTRLNSESMQGERMEHVHVSHHDQIQRFPLAFPGVPDPIGDSVRRPVQLARQDLGFGSVDRSVEERVGLYEGQGGHWNGNRFRTPGGWQALKKEEKSLTQIGRHDGVQLAFAWGQERG